MPSVQNEKGPRNCSIVIRRGLLIALLFGSLTMMSITLSGTNARIQSLEQSPHGKFLRVAKAIPNQYIVVLDDGIAGADVASIAASLGRIHGGTVGQIYRYALRGFSITGLPEAAAIGLSQNPQVEFVEENGEGSVGTTQTITYPGGPWGLDRIDQTDIGCGGTLSGTYTYTQTGAGVNAYIIDTGLRTTHSQFGGRASFGADFVNDGQASNADCTTGIFTEGHGTLVASIAGGDTTDPQQTSFGVAKSVNL